MERIKIAPEYSADYLETERPQPLTDNTIEDIIKELLPHKWGYYFEDSLYSQFKSELQDWITSSTLNTVTGLDSFTRTDVIQGCTQFIDNLYMQGPVQTIKGDYRYHSRLNPDIAFSVPGYLRPNVPLIIAMPFPSTGSVHTQMKEILDEAGNKGIDVHVDGAWFTCCRGINFDVSHSAIKSVGISLSKGLGLGWNRIGVRWTRQTTPDSVTIQNDFRMVMRGPVIIGLHFLRQLPPDYLWNKYGTIYQKICRDFELTPTQSIYLALRNGEPVGLSPLIRHVANQ